MHLGEASGMAAAMSAGTGRPVQEVDIKQLQKKLKSAGIPLEMPAAPSAAVSGGEVYRALSIGRTAVKRTSPHTYDTTSGKVDAGQDGTEQAWDTSPTSTSWTSGIDYLPGGSGDLTGHLGPYNSDEDSDNRPQYRVVAFIERFK